MMEQLSFDVSDMENQSLFTADDLKSLLQDNKIDLFISLCYGKSVKLCFE